MTMQSDVKVTQPLTTTGVFKTQSNADFTFRGRVKGIYIQNGASAGSVIVADGQGGNVLFTINTPTAANSGDLYIPVPDQGILAEIGLYGTVTNAASITIFYG